MKRAIPVVLVAAATMVLLAALGESGREDHSHSRNNAEENAKRMIDEGRHVFRYDTFGDEAFWTDQLHIQQAVSGISPQTALALGLKVDAEASPIMIEAAFVLRKHTETGTVVKAKNQARAVAVRERPRLG